MLGINSMKRLISMVLTAALVITFAVCMNVESSYAGSSVIIGQAANGEKGLKGNSPGDQTGKEVATTTWKYSGKSSSCYHWIVVIRCKDSSKARKMAQVVKDACDNNNVGYDQGTEDRQTFYYALKEAGWDAKKITKKVETSCTPLVAAAINAAGITTATRVSSQGLYKNLKNDSNFICYTSSSYVSSSSKLMTGDILISSGHTAMVVSSPNTDSSFKSTSSSPKNTSSSSISSPFKVGKEYVLASNLNVRTGPSTSYSIKSRSSLTANGKKNSLNTSKATLKKGTVVTCIQTSGNWIKIPSGWICGKSGSKTYIKAYTASSTKSSATTAKSTKSSTTTSKKSSTTASKNTSTKSSSKLAVKKGGTYKLKDNMNVRKGPGTSYAIKKRSELTADGKKNAVNCTNAVLKKGTVVTCLEVKGEWMRIPSGWICCKSEYITSA